MRGWMVFGKIIGFLHLRAIDCQGACRKFYKDNKLQINEFSSSILPVAGLSHEPESPILPPTDSEIFSLGSPSFDCADDVDATILEPTGFEGQYNFSFVRLQLLT